MSSLIIICNHNHFGGRPGVNLAKQLLITNSGLFMCMKMIPCNSYMYDGSNILWVFFFSYRLSAKVLMFPETLIHNDWILLALSFYEQVDRKSFWHRTNGERCYNGLSLR